MRRICQVVRLKPEAREEYLRLHRAVWPAVLETIARCGIHNYSIFLQDDTLIAYFEYAGVDLEADMRVMAADPETQRWWRLTDPMQERLPGTPDDAQWLEVPEVFHVD
jgi:L-rhamnose mutarotase